MLRRALSSTTVVVGTAAVRCLSFSEQNQALTDLQKAKKYKHNLWLETWDAQNMKATLKAGEAPTTAQVPKVMSLYNLDQFINPPEMTPAKQHSGVASGRPYSKSLSFELEASAEENQFFTKWWITAAAARKRGMQTKVGQKVNHFPMKIITKLYNVCQYEEAETLRLRPISGFTLRPYPEGNDLEEALRRHTVANKFPTSVYLTKMQADIIKAKPRIDATGCDVEPTNQGIMGGLYNIDQALNKDEVLDNLQRGPTLVHSFLGTGEEISGLNYLRDLESAPFESKYWFSKNDCSRYNIVLLPGATPAVISGKQRTSFNIYEFTDPTSVFSVLGTILR